MSVYSISGVRFACKSDIYEILSLMESYVASGVLLPRSEADILKNLPATWVSEESGKITGTISLVDYGNNLFEARAFVVKPEYQKKGTGKALVQEVIHYLNAKKKSLNQNVTLFALTYVPEFFKQFGLSIVSKEKFPQKIFEVCQYCKKADNCLEVAVELII